MGRRAINRDYYNEMLAAFRAAPGLSGTVAKLVGCDVRTARRAWELGFAYGPLDVRRPIKKVLEEEQAIARARRQEEEDLALSAAAESEAHRRAELAEKARKDVTETRLQEGQMIKLARGNCMQLLAMVAQVGQGVQNLGKQVKATLDGLGTLDPDTGKLRTLSMSEMRLAVNLMNATANVVRQVNEAASRSMEMERLHMGEPSKIIGVQVEAITMDEADRRLRSATAALARAKARGIIIDQPVFGGTLDRNNVTIATGQEMQPQGIGITKFGD